MTDSNEFKAITIALDVIKLTLALATGSLVFSAGLLTEKLTFSCALRFWLIGSWILLGVSVIGGVLGMMRIPMIVHDGNPDVNDKLLTYCMRIHHLSFIAGIILLGIALTQILTTATAPPPL